MALKAKKNLSGLFRIAMRNAANTAKINTGDSQISDTGFERNDDKRFLKIGLEMSDFLPRKSRTRQGSRDRMQTDHDKKQSQVMMKFAQGYARKFGTEAMFDVLAKMGKEAGLNEYNAVIKLCVQHARTSNDVESALDLIESSIGYLKEMKQRGFTIGTGTYGPFLKYLVDMGMVEEFQICKDVIIETNPDALVKISYYEMLLWIQVKDEEKIHEICSRIADNGKSLSILQEYYMVALCEKDRKENLQRLLEIVDITKLSSPLLLTNIFGYLGRSLLESIAMKFLRELVNRNNLVLFYCIDGGKNVSNLIFSYASCIPNSTVEDSVLKFNKLHKELDIMPSPSSYDTHYLSLRLK